MVVTAGCIWAVSVEATVPTAGIILNQASVVGHVVLRVRLLHQHTLVVVDAQNGEVERIQCRRAAVRLVLEAELQVVKVRLAAGLERKLTSTA